jgi:23S rRNA pseudouridine2605 synthase
LNFDLSKFETKIYAFRKGVGVICSRKDDKGRPTIYDFLQKYNFNHLMKVGRLDYNTEGLLLLTNDGDLARNLELPSSKVKRKYLVKIFGNVTPHHLDKFSQGSMISGVQYGKIKTKIVSSLKNYTWIEVELYEGKNREIRNVFNHMKMNVCRLIRIQYGPYKLNSATISKNQLKELSIHKEFLKYTSVKP